MVDSDAWLSLDARLLKRLFENATGYLSLDVLSSQLRATVSLLRERLEILEHCGYPIERHAHFGVRFGELGDVMCSDEILGRLGATYSHDFLWRVVHLRETKSTMDVAAREAVAGSPQGLVVAADDQTSGRGRHGKVWSSAAQRGIYLSMIFRPPWPPEEISRLTLIASLAAAEAIETLIGHSVQIKWPNDIMIDGRKAAGLLTEAHYEGGRLRFAVMGIGLNINHRSECFPDEIRSTSTSLFQITGKEWRRADVIVNILKAIASRYGSSFSEVSRLWSERCLTLGKNVRLETPQGVVEGQAMGLDDSGALLVRRESGKIDRVRTGLLV